MASIDKESIAETCAATRLFGHPRGLFTLFSPNFGAFLLLWYEPYCFTIYTRKSLMAVSALIKRPGCHHVHIRISRMSSVIGGWLVNRVFGTNTVFYGGILIMFGHIALAFPSSTAAFYQHGSDHYRNHCQTKRIRVVGDLYMKEDAPRLGFQHLLHGDQPRRLTRR